MPWWPFKQGPPPDATISLWIGSIRTEQDRQIFQSMLKEVQQNLFAIIATKLMTSVDEFSIQVASLLVHFFSGRAELPAFQVVAESSPKEFEAAKRVYDDAVRSGLSEPLKSAAVIVCSFEVTNECKERHYDEALRIANHGVNLWPDVAELFRQRGVLKIATRNYHGAFQDLRKAQELRPQMLWLDEPLASASRLREP